MYACSCQSVLSISIVHFAATRFCGCISRIVAATSTGTRDSVDEGPSIQGSNEVFVNTGSNTYLPERIQEQTGDAPPESQSRVIPASWELGEELDTGAFRGSVIGQCLRTYCASSV